MKAKLSALIVAVGLASFVAGAIAQSRFPYIDQAEGSLNNALGALGAARDIFGGHKINAENLIRQAISELETGKAVAAANGY